MKFLISPVKLTSFTVNNDRTGQTARISKLVCAFVVRMRQNQIFSRRGPRKIGFLVLCVEFNPCKPNGIFHYYQLDRFISVLRVVRWYFFHFYSNFDRTFSKQTVETLVRRRVLRRLIWVCTVAYIYDCRTYYLCIF